MPRFISLTHQSEQRPPSPLLRIPGAVPCVRALKALARMGERAILFMLIKPELKGAYMYKARPKRRGKMAHAFNGQLGRQAIFAQLIESIDFEKIIETGTYMGLTTAYMSHHSSLPVITGEANAQYFAYAQQRFKARHKADAPNIDGRHSDSRSFLKQVLKEHTDPNATLLFYLDAHWYDDLPLREEVEIIFSMHPNSVILVDDFKVPDDDAYTYDDYGHPNILHLPYLEPITHIGFHTFFPSLPGEQETGAKRGCVVLVKDDNLLAQLHTLDTLRHYTHQPS